MEGESRDAISCLITARSEFIHFATEDQLPHVIGKFYKNQDYLVLKIVTEKLFTSGLVYETNPGGSVKYYHLYNAIIPWDAIVN